MADLGFSVSEQDAAGHSGTFEVIEPGWKKVVIVASEVKTTKSGNGKILELKYELQDGTGRSLPDRLNIINPSEVAQRIGRGALAKIAIACGLKGAITNSNILHGRPFEAKVEVEEFESNTESGKMLKSNKISDYRAVQVKPVTTETKTPTAW